MATIYLIRHGQASFGSANYDQLSELGQLQATRTGQYLARAGITLDAAYSGDLSRQRETCERACKELGGNIVHHIDPRFNEIRNDEQVKHLTPVVAEHNPALKQLLATGLSNSKHYQKLIEAVFNYWVSNDCSAHGIQSWDEYSGLAQTALAEVMNNEGSGKSLQLSPTYSEKVCVISHPFKSVSYY